MEPPGLEDVEPAPVPDGTGLVGTGLEVAPTPEGAELGAGIPGAVVLLASQAVQTVVIEVKVTVDTVLEVVVIVLEPEVMVEVTGQVVTVV